MSGQVLFKFKDLSDVAKCRAVYDYMVGFNSDREHQTDLMKMTIEESYFCCESNDDNAEYDENGILKQLDGEDVKP